MIQGSPLYLEQGQSGLILVSPHRDPDISRFFRWEDPLEEIGAALIRDRGLSRAFQAYAGLRLIRQDPWSCMAGFILSMFSSIAKIEKTLENLARHKKKSVRFMSTKLHPIPPPEEIASMREQTLRNLGMGFRAPYLLATAKKIANGFPLHSLKALPYPEAKQALLELPGIGEKVADCILLFSLDHLEAFPVDVWIQRALERRYFSGKSRSAKYLSEWGRERFGAMAGYAQQYLYIDARGVRAER